ncbi:MAG: 7TM domain-containing protein [Patescibacteria group bacterium]
MKKSIVFFIIFFFCFLVFSNFAFAQYSNRGAELGITNFMAYGINYLVNNGVAIENIFLILILPIIASVVAFTRQFLGIKTFGIYTPTIITLSFVAMGLKFGLVFFIVIMILATLFRFALKKSRLLYLPRMALLLTIVAFAIFVIFLLGAKFNIFGIISLSIFPILILIIMSEKFIAAQIEKGGWQTIILTLETILVSIACYFLITWPWFKNFILTYPELTLLTLIIDVLLGKWIGLRLSEYLRFQELRKFIKERG